MGSQLGDYVHWRRKQYERFGISEKGKDGSTGKKPRELTSYFNSARKTMIERARKTFTTGLSSKEIRELEDFYSMLFFPKADLNGADKELIKKFQESWEKIFEKFRDGNLVLNGDGGIVRDVKKGASPDNSYMGGFLAGKKELTSKDIEDIIKLLKSATHRSGNKKTTEHMRSDLALMKKILTRIGSGPGRLGRNNQDLIQEIKERFINRNFYTLFGAAFEDGLVAANLIKKGYEGEVDKKVYEAIMTGNQRSSARIEDSFITDIIGDRKESILNKATKNNDKDFSYDIRSTQNKVDITFEYKGKPINMSAKYVGKNTNNIAVHSGSSFLKLLQQAEGDVDIEWFNHYLNIATEKGENDSLYDRYANARATAIKTFKVLAAIKGLTGNILGKEGQANMLTVYDAAKRRVRLIDMSVAIKRLETLVQNGGIDLGQDLDDLNSIPYGEHWTKNSLLDRTQMRERLSRIIAFLNEQKYHITLNKKMLVE